MTEEDLIRRLREYAQLATRNTSWHPDREDWVQEAVVAGWSEWKKDPDRKPGYYFRAALNRILSVRRGDPMLGSPPREGWYMGRKAPTAPVPLETDLDEDQVRLEHHDTYPSDTAHLREALASIDGAPGQVIDLLNRGFMKKDAAQILGKSPAWVSKQLGFAREQLAAEQVAA